MARDEVLARVELSFRTDDDPQALADRVREAAALIVGREALEEFRVRIVPLSHKPKASGPD
ncbi:MAG TPA: hypothetical protein VFI59_05270 [Actinomycetota bacterium]|nr:hypothetical protein [Actinomycetota bacterium]